MPLGGQTQQQPPQDEECVLAAALRAIKRSLVSDDSNAQIIEAVPAEPSLKFPVPADDLRMLHRFASANPVYHNSRELVLAGIRCIVYEGDINKYWLGSILHASSRSPFSPTWIASAYVLARFARRLGYSQAVDVGSGDGRISFCASLLGLDAHGIEIDADLVDLQMPLARMVGFKPHRSDAVSFDYAALNLTKPAVFIGGLAQMGGVSLAESVMRGLADARHMQDRDATGSAGWVLAGTTSPKYPVDPKGMYGWGDMMARTGLYHVRTVELPTVWSFEQTDDTRYVFAKRL